VSGAPPARFPWRRYVGFALLILLLALLPVISVAIAATLANLNGCALDEGSVHPCLIAGADWGETLYTLSVLGWLGLATIPFGIAGLGMLLVALLVHRFTWRRARRREIEP
jgi:hypothetical protein